MHCCQFTLRIRSKVRLHARFWHMAGIFRAAAKPSLVWGTADLQIIGGKIPDKTLPDPAIMTTDAKVFMDAPFCDDISNNCTYDGHDDSNHDLRKPISHLWAL